MPESDLGFGFVATVTSLSDDVNFEWRPGILNSGKGSNTYLRKLGKVNSPSKSKPSPEPLIDLAKAYVELAGYIPNIQCLVISGWVLGELPTDLLVQGDDAPPVKLVGAHRLYRPDVFNAFGKEQSAQNPLPGFVAYAHLDKQPQKIRLLQATGDSKKPHRTLCEQEVKPQIGDPKSIFEWMSGLQTSAADLPQRYATIDIPIVEAVIRKDRASWGHLPTRIQTFGTLPAKPQVSIVVPLYGRTDFVEHQLIEFARDPWLLKNAEIIYVLDDPSLLAAFMVQSRQLHKLYQVPFSWIWGAINRGFSGANNLGASIAKGKHLLFLNSDAFPIAPGWLQTLVNTLEASPQHGAVSPRLLHFDGSIQHASMAFDYRSDLGFYINHHPRMGLAPELDPYTEATIVPAVTGACMLLRKQHFDQVGGWDTGYLIGDFEDSDLCLKLREAALHTIYEPRVQLTHLERQSFKLIGGGDFRTRVVTYNATRHQLRWAQALATLADTPAP
jgi:GT2 family glycosyltransferase